MFIGLIMIVQEQKEKRNLTVQLNHNLRRNASLPLR